MKKKFAKQLYKLADKLASHSSFWDDDEEQNPSNTKLPSLEDLKNKIYSSSNLNDKHKNDLSTWVEEKYYKILSDRALTRPEQDQKLFNLSKELDIMIKG